MTRQHARFMQSGLAVLCLILFFAAPAMAQEAAPEISTAPLALKLIMRWMHILCAILLLGGTGFVWMVLRPVAAEVLDRETHARLREAVYKKWKILMMIYVTGFLVSGFYNYLFVTRFEHDGQPQYHMMFGIKFLLAMAVFAVAMMLSSSKGYAVKMRENGKLWGGITLALGVVIVVIAGYMKLM